MLDTTAKKVARCVLCREEFTEEQIAGQSACPSCGAAGKPMDPERDVEIKINWHELRILGIWAEWWAQKHLEEHPDMLKSVHAIARAIQNQHPDMGPITFSGEIQELKQALPGTKIEVHGLRANGPDAPMPEKWEEVIDDDA